MAMGIPDRICQTNKKLFVTVNPKCSCKLEFTDHIWLRYLDQPQWYVLVFEIFFLEAKKMCNIMES